ncbi:MAG TPA: carbohydrate ABC transporter permease [Tissierellaceae bacterium]
MRKSSSIYYSRSDKIFAVVNTIFLLFIFIIVVYPLIYVLSASFSSTQAVMSGRVWLLPVEPTLLGYKAVFNNRSIMTGYANSFYYTVLGTVINVFMTILAAYPLARKSFYGRNLIMGIFTFTMLFSGGLIPTYLLVKQLGLINTRWAMVIPNAMSVWNVIVARTFFSTTIPEELYEAGELDGCSDIGFISKIVIPLSGPIIAVLTLFYAVGHWNSYFQALIYLKDAELFPLQIILRNILIQNETSGEMMRDISEMQRRQGMAELLKYSLIVVASIPVLIMYPFVQKYFVRGVMIGALKG